MNVKPKLDFYINGKLINNSVSKLRFVNKIPTELNRIRIAFWRNLTLINIRIY